MTGTVKEYDKAKGFGFITGDDGEDYFVHVYGLGPKLKQFGLRTGQKVICLLYTSPSPRDRG